jgi:DoxX-like family
MTWTLVPAALLAAALAASCLRKARRAPSSVDLRNRLGVAPSLWAGIGVLEGFAALGLLVGLARPAVGTAAAAGVALLMLGAVVAHRRAGLSGRPLLPPMALLAVAVVAGLGFSTSV